MLVCPDASTTTLSAALAKLQGQYASNYPELMAAAVMACLPMIVIYLLFQRQFVQGIATTGGKLQLFASPFVYLSFTRNSLTAFQAAGRRSACLPLYFWQNSTARSIL